MNAALQRAIIGVLERHPDVVGAYVFGSQARGDTTPVSDVDLAVVFDRPRPLESLVSLQEDLECAVHVPVDLEQPGDGRRLTLSVVRRNRRAICAAFVRQIPT